MVPVRYRKACAESVGSPALGERVDQGGYPARDEDAAAVLYKATWSGFCQVFGRRLRGLVPVDRQGIQVGTLNTAEWTPLDMNCAKCGKEIAAGQEVKKGFFTKKSYHKECAG